MCKLVITFPVFPPYSFNAWLFPFTAFQRIKETRTVAPFSLVQVIQYSIRQKLISLLLIYYNSSLSIRNFVLRLYYSSYIPERPLSRNMSGLVSVNGPFETAIREWTDPGVQHIADELLRVQDLKLISTLYAYEAGGANPGWSFCALLKAVLRCRPNVGDSLSSIPSISLYPWAVGLSQWGLHRIDHDHQGRKDLVEKMAVGVLHRLCGPCQCHDALGQSEAPRLISSRVDTASDKDTSMFSMLFTPGTWLPCRAQLIANDNPTCSSQKD